MATSNDLTTLDFSTIKENLKTYLKSQAIFQDYDFEASNINVLLDVLAYNTYMNSFYLNMISNEMFLDSALMKDSIVSHAKELNYIPRSFRSARARVNITLNDSSEDATILIPRGTTFTGNVGNRNFTFTIPENIQAKSTNTTNEFLAENVFLYEGNYTSDSYVTNTLNQPRFLITNKTVDTDSIRVTVLEDNGETAISYVLRDSLFGIDSTDAVFFLQAAENDSYEIIFGDGIIGRVPKNNSIVLIEYRICNGELPNGINKFYADDDIGTAKVLSIETISSAAGGSIPESLSSIKFNAPRAFTTQERVVTANDYATLLKANFTEINDVIAYGGEENNPPMFGKVIVAIDLKNTDDLPETYRTKYRDFIKPRSPLSIDPVFVRPDYTYVSIETIVNYDINRTSLNIDDIKSLVISAIQNYNEENINGFGKTLRYSKLLSEIDNAQASIVSNNTEVLALKFVRNANARQNVTLDFGFALQNNLGQRVGYHPTDQISTVHSSAFIFQGEECTLEDDGLGTVNIVKETGTQHEIIAAVGTVNYETGLIILENIGFSNIFGGVLKVFVRPRSKDITSQRRTILRVLDEFVNVQIRQVRI